MVRMLIVLAVIGATEAQGQLFCRNGQCNLRTRTRLARPMVASPRFQRAPATCSSGNQMMAAPSTCSSLALMETPIVCQPVQVSTCAPKAVYATSACSSAMGRVQTYRRGLFGRFRPIRSWAPMAAPMMTYESRTVAPAETKSEPAEVDTGYFSPPPAPVPSLGPAMVAGKEERPNFRMM
jgi:hypothetical protein